MKILILLDSLAIGGGAEKIATTLGDELYHKGYEIHYLTFQDKKPQYQCKGEYHTLDGKTSGNIVSRGYNFIKYSARIKKICDDLSINTIISLGEIPNLHAVLSRLMGNKVVLIVSQHINPEIHLNNRLKVNAINFFYSQADKTVCVSRETEEILKEKFGVTNTMTIYNMVDVEKNIKLAQEELPEDCKEIFNQELNQDGFNFINVGSLYPQKGHCYLIRSFRKVVDHHLQAKLFILGEGDLRDELEDLIGKLGLKRNVYLLGNKANVFPFLKNSHCFVFSSLWEGFGMVLVEALSINIPVISTDCKTGPREVLSELDLFEEIEYPYYGEYGILTQPINNKLIFEDLKDVPLNKSELMLAKLMMIMIENPSLREKYSNGIDRAYDFDQKKIINYWKKIIMK